LTSGDGVESPLVMHQGAIGDTIQLVAMLRSLERRFGAPCDVVTGAVPASDLFAGLSCVRQVRQLRNRRLPLALSREQRGLLAWLRQRGQTPTYVVERWRHRVAPWSALTRQELLLARAGVPRSHVVTTVDCPRGPLEHAVDYLLRLSAVDPAAYRGRAAAADPGLQPTLVVSAEEIAECRAWLRGRGWGGEPLMLLQSTSRRKKRGRWPKERWVRLGREMLADRVDGWLLLIGAPRERRQTAALRAAIGHARAHDVAAELPLRRLFALLSLADSLISLDSAPVHAAAAVECPVVVIAGTADPRRNAPRGRGRVEVVTGFGAGPWPADGRQWFDRHDASRIEVTSVLAAWRRLGPRGPEGGG
jgi:heptosyltransferase-2/heptosyltransferase-3